MSSPLRHLCTQIGSVQVVAAGRPRPASRATARVAIVPTAQSAAAAGGCRAASAAAAAAAARGR